MIQIRYQTQIADGNTELPNRLYGKKTERRNDYLSWNNAGYLDKIITSFSNWGYRKPIKYESRFTNLVELNVSTNHFIDTTSVVGNYYYYSLYSGDTANNWSAYIPTLTVRSEISHDGPYEPTNFSATPSSNGSVMLKWNNQGLYNTDFKSIKIYRSKLQPANSPTINNPTYTELPLIMDGSNHVYDYNLIHGQTYHYSIFASDTTNSTGKYSLYYLGNTTSTAIPDNIPPDPPSNFYARGLVNGHIELNWKNSGKFNNDFNKINIIRSTYQSITTTNLLSINSPSNFETKSVVTLTNKSQSFIDTTTQIGKRYYYSIFAGDHANNWSRYISNFSVNGQVVADNTKPDQPTLRVSESNFTISTSNLNILWYNHEDYSDIVKTKYKIGTSEFGNEVRDWKEVSTIDSLTITSLNLTVNQTYYVTVKVLNSVGLWSDETTFKKTILPKLTKSDIPISIKNQKLDTYYNQMSIQDKCIINLDLSNFNENVKKSYVAKLYRKRTVFDNNVSIQTSASPNDDLIESISGSTYQSDVIPIEFDVANLENNAQYYVVFNITDNAQNNVTVSSVDFRYVSLSQHDIYDLYFFPNPLNPNVNTGTIQFKLGQASNITLTIFDLSGRPMFSYEGFHPYGTVNLTWNGRNSFGSIVSNGIYIGHIVAKDIVSGEEIRKVIKIAILR